MAKRAERARTKMMRAKKDADRPPGPGVSNLHPGIGST